MLGSSFGSYQATTMGTNSNSESHMAQGSAAGGEDTTGGKAHSKHTSRRSTETSSAVSRKPPFSLRMWKLAAKQQNVDANIRAGDMYFYGLQGIPVDFEQAAAHYNCNCIRITSGHVQSGMALSVRSRSSRGLSSCEAVL